MAPTVYLVSGANRGIGKSSTRRPSMHSALIILPGLGIVKALSLREDVVVFAGARNPSAADELQQLSKQLPDKVHVVNLTSGNKANNEAAVTKVKELAGRLDVVIANAGELSIRIGN